MIIAVNVTSYLWFALEIALLVRDRVRGMGSVDRDRGTRFVTFLVVVVAVAGAQVVGAAFRHSGTLSLPGSGYGVAGLVVMWVGLVLRVWAILALGQSFRTTVEVWEGQQVVRRGPYRWVRHPSYTGLLLLAIGVGIAMDDWVSLALTVVLPITAVLWRISVEERELVHVLGGPYESYRAQTKRLVPGLW